jgi:hypothetical protein
MGGDRRRAAAAVCKIAGVVYEGPTNLAMTPDNVPADGPGQVGA